MYVTLASMTIILDFRFGIFDYLRKVVMVWSSSFSRKNSIQPRMHTDEHGFRLANRAFWQLDNDSLFGAARGKSRKVDFHFPSVSIRVPPWFILHGSGFSLSAVWRSADRDMPELHARKIARWLACGNSVNVVQAVARKSRTCKSLIIKAVKPSRTKSK